MGEWAEEIPDYAIDLARAFWPGPMTLILNRSELAKDFVTGNQNTVGIRVPNQTLALQLLNEFSKIGGKGIAAPSANRFGQVSPTTAEAVREEIGDFLNDTDQIINDGPCAVGIESTIINCTTKSPEILRPGFITVQMVAESTGLKVTAPNTDIRVSGNLQSHYAPNAKVEINKTPQPGEGLMALSSIKTPEGVIRLSSPNTLEEFARDLYQAMRLADLKGLAKISIQVPEGDGLATAILDRVQKAANS